MLAYSNEARLSHMKNIEKIISVLGEIPTEYLNYFDYRMTIQYLNQLKKEYKKELTK